MNKILIIDDRPDDRIDIYKNVLGERFELYIVEKASDLFNMINEYEVDAYIIDIVLSRWRINKKPLQLMDVLVKIGKNKPVILVSNEYDNLVSKGDMTPLLNSIIDNGYNVNSFLLWRDFESYTFHEDLNNAGSIVARIELDILKNQKELQNKSNYDFALICALKEELEPFLENINEFNRQEFNGISFIEGNLTTKGGVQRKFIATELDFMGNVEAAITTTRISNHFIIKRLFMTGVCAGRKGKVKTGDIIIPLESVAYQHGKITNDGFEIEISFAAPPDNIKSKLVNLPSDLLNNLRRTYINHLLSSSNRTISTEVPEIKFDSIACGELVVNKEGMIDEISRKIGKRKLRGLDMESYGFYKVAKKLNQKATVIKSVMDYGEGKSDEFKDYAAYLSANFLYQLIYQEIIDF